MGKKNDPIEKMFIDVGIPAELMPPKMTATEPYTQWTWRFILDQLTTGATLVSILRNNPNMPKDEARLRRWIFNDPARKAEYEQAQQIGTEALTDRMLEIAEGVDSMEDVHRSNLRVNTLKWLVGCRNRDRYGDKKQIEQTVNISIADAMEKADRRVIDLKAEVIKGLTDDSDNNNGSDSMGDL